MPIDLDDDSSSVQSQDTDKRESRIIVTQKNGSLNVNPLLSVPETPTSVSKMSKGSSKESTPIPEVPEESSPPRPSPPVSVASSGGSGDAPNRKRLAEDSKEKEDERKPVSSVAGNKPPRSISTIISLSGRCEEGKGTCSSTTNSSSSCRSTGACQCSTYAATNASRVCQQEREARGRHFRCDCRQETNASTSPIAFCGRHRTRGSASSPR